MLIPAGNRFAKPLLGGNREILHDVQDDDAQNFRGIISQYP